MVQTVRVFTLVARACSGLALLAPIARWALRVVRSATLPPVVRRRARGREAVRRGRPTTEVRRAGPRADRRAGRRAGRREALLPPRGS
jgi:hypothetical protein